MTVSNYKEKLAAMNEMIYFDKNDYLREKTSNPAKLNELIEEGECLLRLALENDLYFLHGTLGNLYRINGQSKKAITSLAYSLQLAVAEGHAVREIVALIRMGEAYKYDCNHTVALNLFNQALEKCTAYNVEVYLDFVWQHKGKCLMELARFSEAEECLLHALKLRKSKGDASLIDSTEQAIALLKEL